MNESTPTSKKTLMSEKRAHSSKVSLLGEHQEEIWDRTPKFTRMNSLECWDYTIELECLNGPQDLQLAAELGKTLLERNKELENLLRSHQRKCEDQKQEIEYLTKQNIALKEVNDSRMQIYETLDVSIRDLEIEKHELLVQTSSDKKLIKSLKQTIDALEQKCDEYSKQIESISQSLDAERRKSARLRENNASSITSSSTTNNYAIESPMIVLKSIITADNSSSGRSSHTSSASEPDHEEACTPTNPSKTFTSCGQHHNLSPQIPFNFTSQDFQSIQPIYSLESHDSGFKTECSSNSAENEEILKLASRLEESGKHLCEERNKSAQLEDELAALSRENHELRSQIAKVNTIDDMKSIHEELSILEEVRQGQMCTRCLKAYDSRMVPTENTSYIGTEADEDDRSIMDLIANSVPVYRSAITIKDDDASSQASDASNEDNNTYNPYKDLVEKYEKLLELKRSACTRQDETAQQIPAPMSLHDELLQSADFSSLNTKFTSADETQKSSKSENARRKTPTDYSETETTSSSGFSDETSTKATQTESVNGSFSFSIADGDDCSKFTIYDETAPVETRFNERPAYRDLFKEIFSVLKKAAENKDEGKKLPLLDDMNKSMDIIAEPSKNEQPSSQDFDAQSMMSSAISEDSVAVSECITKTERKKVISHKKQALKEGSENKPPAAVQMVGGNLVTPYNRLALDFDALMAKKRTRRGRRRSKDKQAGRDSSVCSNASSTISNVQRETIHEVEPVEPAEEVVAAEEDQDQSTLTRNSGRKGGKRASREFYQALSTSNSTAAGTSSDWNGQPMTIYNRSIKTKNPSNYYCPPRVDNSDNTSEIEFKHSAAHSELRKLKKLDKSYAEVLRNADRDHRRYRRK